MLLLRNLSPFIDSLYITSLDLPGSFMSLLFALVFPAVVERCGLLWVCFCPLCVWWALSVWQWSQFWELPLRTSSSPIPCFIFLQLLCCWMLDFLFWSSDSIFSLQSSSLSSLQCVGVCARMRVARCVYVFLSFYGRFFWRLVFKPKYLFSFSYHIFIF